MWSLSEWGSIPAPKRGIKPLLGGFLGSAEDEKRSREKFQNRGESSGFRNTKICPRLSRGHTLYGKDDRLLLIEHLVGLGHLLEDAGVLLGGDSLDDQQGGDHQNDGDDHADHSALDDAGNDEADEGNGSHGDTVGGSGWPRGSGGSSGHRQKP